MKVGEVVVERRLDGWCKRCFDGGGRVERVHATDVQSNGSRSQCPGFVLSKAHFWCMHVTGRNLVNQFGGRVCEG